MSERTILHVDMNAFFAAVEQQTNPALRGKPVGVIGAGARTILTTASYEARTRGVKTGMTIYEAKQRCPEIVLVVGNNRRYTHTSIGIVAILRDYTPLVEVFSIDEAFLDLTGCLSLFGPPERIAHQIKARIRHRFGLACSIGIAPNKLLAKLASEMKKPDGLTILQPAEIPDLLETVPAGELCGIGPKLQRQLALLGVRTCGELGRFPLAILTRKFGVVGTQLQRMGRGEDASPVVPAEAADEVKSVGHSMTLDRDLFRPEDIRRRLLELAEMVGRRARRYGVAGRTITLTVRYADFSTFSTQETGREYINRSDRIYAAAAAILGRLCLAQPVRLLGVRLSGLRSQVAQYSLFPEEQKLLLVAEAMDQVNDRYGTASVTFGSLLGQDGRSHVIAPAWRPEGIRYVDVE
jgi:DNA polymerase IV